MMLTAIDGGRKLLYGTNNGIYLSERKNKDQIPRRVLEPTNVTQIELLEEYSLLLVLSNKTLQSYPMSSLNPDEPALSKRPKKIQNHCNFFKTGICLGRHLVCCVKSSALSTTIKVFEPNDAMTKGKKQKGLGKFMAGGQDELKPFKEFYIPTESSSVHFLKSKLCVACARGFEVVSLETLETQSLLDQADTSLDFVARKENVKPIHIERLNGEFLLNYSEFSFFVNRNGWRARPEWRIDWEGTPISFALSYPWILAFEANFIELRNIENGAVHIVPHKNIRMLHSSTHEVSSTAHPLCALSEDLKTDRNNCRSSLRTRTIKEKMLSRQLTSGKTHASRRCSGRHPSHFHHRRGSSLAVDTCSGGAEDFALIRCTGHWFTLHDGVDENRMTRMATRREELCSRRKLVCLLFGLRKSCYQRQFRAVSLSVVLAKGDGGCCTRLLVHVVQLSEKGHDRWFSVRAKAKRWIIVVLLSLVSSLHHACFSWFFCLCAALEAHRDLINASLQLLASPLFVLSKPPSIIIT